MRLRWIFREQDSAPSEGAVARANAERALAQHQSQHREVVALSASMRQMRERNHFADSIRDVFEGNRPS